MFARTQECWPSMCFAFSEEPEQLRLIEIDPGHPHLEWTASDTAR